MKTLVAIIVYDRFDNLQRWIECWKQCEKQDCELVVIHNYDETTPHDKYLHYCIDNGIKCVGRKNIGFDIGAFQDVCLERLEGFPNDWENILWVTDDCIPMSKNFVKPFIDNIEGENVGCSCMEISMERAKHIRTTGFCIKKSTAKRLIFQSDVILSKADCYFFEHLGGDKTLINQIYSMGMSAKQVCALTLSPLWDIGNRAKLARWEEHNRIFMDEKKILFVCPIFNAHPTIISALISQSHKNWELLLIHDGIPNDDSIQKIVDAVNDPRIKYIIHPDRKGNYGHGYRQWALNEIKLGNLKCEYVVITNGDNYHTPNYCSVMLSGFDKNKNAVASFCSQMIHSYIQWQILECRMALGYVDCAGVMVKSEVASAIGWNDIIGHSSDWTYFSDIAKVYGFHAFEKVRGTLLVHN